MTALHATEPATPHLALWARTAGITIDDVEQALYDERTLVKTMGMRRTLFVVSRELLPAIVGSAGRRVAMTERRRLAKEATEIEQALGEGWVAAATAEIVAHLTDRECSARELRDDLAYLAGPIIAAPGTKWPAEVSAMTRLLTILSAEGYVVRGHNNGHWRISRPLWTAMASWLGEELVPADAAGGYAEVVGNWLWTFGPGTEADLAWWLGSTKAAVRGALADLEAVPVQLDDGATGWVLPDDTADLDVRPEAEPWVSLLPSLDPTTMGWRQRDFYLDPAHAPFLFDATGNGGTTVWVNGRIVGCWVQGADEHVRPVLLEELSRSTQRLLDAEVARLDEFLAGQHITNVYASPLMKRERLR
jgi:hypothetical protein